MSSVLKWIRFPQLRKILNWTIIPPGFNVAEHRLLPSISMLTLAKASSPGIYLFLMEPVTFHSAFCCFSMFPVSRSEFSRKNSLAGDLAQKLEMERTQRTQDSGQRTQRTQERTQYKDSQTSFSGNEDNTGEGVSLLNVSCLIAIINDQWLGFQKKLSFEKSKFEWCNFF